MAWPPTTPNGVENFVRYDVVANIAPLIQDTQDIQDTQNTPLNPNDVQFDVIASGLTVMMDDHTHASAVCWNVTLTHTKAFQGIDPTNRIVNVHGVTVLGVAGPGAAHPGSPEVRRYIDWHAVFAQLGSVPGRAVVNR